MRARTNSIEAQVATDQLLRAAERLPAVEGQGIRQANQRPVVFIVVALFQHRRCRVGVEHAQSSEQILLHQREVGLQRRGRIGAREVVVLQARVDFLQQFIHTHLASP
jgi:hypothetical protein